jgi:hypothetical protein
MKFSKWLMICVLFGVSSSTIFAQRTNPQPSPTPANPRWESRACSIPRNGYELRSDTYSSFTRERALRLRNTLDTNWHLQLPCCPETMPNTDENQLYEESSWFFSCFHPGAEKGVRTSKLYHSLVKPIRSGQQCTYDSRGNLITSNAGAGTPDFVSPNSGDTGEELHWEYDVFPWTKLTFTEYNSVWKPNQGCQQPMIYEINPAIIGHISMYVKRGDIININATGTIIFDVEGNKSSPEGSRVIPRTGAGILGRIIAPVPFPSALPGALLGGVYTGGLASINQYISIDGENLFYVGRGGDFTMPASGYLVFTVNDGYLENNSGSFQATIYRKLAR